MAKLRFTENSWHDDSRFQALCRALVACRTPEEMARLLRDIGTLSELKAWSERLDVARQLARGLTYREVAANTGASTTTVTRVASFLLDGEGGYGRALKAFPASGAPVSARTRRKKAKR
jgi:TrpR-related protein YerC/YecD